MAVTLVFEEMVEVAWVTHPANNFYRPQSVSRLDVFGGGWAKCLGTGGVVWLTGTHKGAAGGIDSGHSYIIIGVLSLVFILKAADAHIMTWFICSNPKVADVKALGL